MAKIADLKIDKDFILKFIRFCIVGAISFLINAGFTYIFLEYLKLDILFATILALIATQPFQFYLSKDWAFRYSEKTRIAQFLYFLGTRFISLLIITVTTDLGTKLIGLEWLFAQLFGVILGMAFNFITANWLVFVEPTNLEERATRDKQINILTLFLIFLGAFCIGLVILTFDPVVVTEDNLTWYLEAKIIIAHQGIPYFTWFHTPLYQYLVAFVIILFNDNIFFLRLIQIIILATSACVIYSTVRLKHERKVAILSALLYATSYTGMYAAHDIHQEGLVVLFIAFMFYFFIRYEKERKKLWLWLGTFAFGAAFFTKEEVLLVIGIYFIYVIFWLKPKKSDLMVCALILCLFFGPFFLVELVQQWHMITLYFSPGSFSGAGFDIWKLLNSLGLELIPLVFSFIYIGVLIIELKKTRKVTGPHAMGFSMLIYLVIYDLSRGYQIHLAYLIFIWCYLGSLGIFWFADFLKGRVKQFSGLMERNPRKAMALVLIPLCVIHLAIFVPNLWLIRNRNHERIVAYQDIASTVGQNATYSQFRDAFGYYIANYYSDYSWFNSYKRNNFTTWNEADVFVLASFQNISDYKLNYFVTENDVAMSQFFSEIISNGSLTLVKTYTVTTQEVWWIAPTTDVIKLYSYPG